MHPSFVLYYNTKLQSKLVSLGISLGSPLHWTKVVPPWGCPLGSPPLWYLHGQQTLYYK